MALMALTRHDQHEHRSAIALSGGTALALLMALALANRTEAGDAQ